MAQNILYKPLSDDQWPQRLCIAILTSPRPLMFVLRGYASRWLRRTTKVEYLLTRHNQVDWTHADGLNTTCMDPLWMAGHFYNNQWPWLHRHIPYSWLKGCYFVENPGLKLQHYRRVEAEDSIQ